LPGKLALPAGGVPLLVRVYRNVSDGHETRISASAPLPPELAALVRAPVAIDRWPRRGPLGGLLSAFAEMESPFVFAVAGDAPFVDAAFIAEIASLRRDGDEAVVPQCEVDGERQLEPLAALYDRRAFLREGTVVLQSGRGSLQAVIERLRTRAIPTDDPQRFLNVNTPQDYARLRVQLEAGHL